MAYLVVISVLPLGPVFQRLISANPELNFNPGFFFFSSQHFLQLVSLFFLEYPVIKL